MVTKVSRIKEVPNDGLIRYLGIFNYERLLLTTPKALSEVLTSKSYTFVKPYQAVLGLKRVLGVGVLLAEGDEHRFQRKHLMPAFSFRHVKELFPVFWKKSAECVRKMTEEINESLGHLPNDKRIANMSVLKVDSDEAVMEVSNFASRATLDIIGVTGMGKDFGAIQDPKTPLAEVYRQITSPSRDQLIIALASLFLHPWIADKLPLQRNLEIFNGVKVIRNVALELIQEKKAKLAKGQLDDLDIISTALESGAFSDENLVDQLMTFLAAGHETTATAMSWAIYMICLHPEKQARLREEIRQHLPSPDVADANVTAADIEGLPYLTAFCSEVLRYYPPVPLTTREASEDTTICGQHVPKGTQIFIVPLATNRDTKLWGDDADVFDPERWLGNANGGAVSNYALETFIHGPRSCIGERFARGEFAALLASWVGRFEFQLLDPSLKDEKKMSVKGGVTARPEKGMWVKAKIVPGW
jgi:cytochrome P450